MLDVGELKEKAAAGDAVSACALGISYMKGKNGLNKDWDAARKYFLEAFPKIKKQAEEGEKYSQYYLGYYYDKLGSFIDDESLIDPLGDKDKILPWYTKAAEQGVAEAQYELGSMYWMSTDFTNRDPDKAFFWFKQAAEQGHAEAQNALARCYENGDGGALDECAAVAWFTKAAEQGSPGAQMNLGRCYEEGAGTEKDYGKAFYWFNKAVEGGEPYALEYLGECYEKGLGVEKDLEKAVEVYTQATKRCAAEFSRTALRRVKRKLKKESEQV
jgi:TPR repeat protein